MLCFFIRQFWFTKDVGTARGYVRCSGRPVLIASSDSNEPQATGAKRMVVFAVLRDKSLASQPIVTVNDPSHHLPIYEAALV